MERFNIFEEQRELIDILEKIDGTLDSTWEQHYEELKTFMEAHNGEEPKARSEKTQEAVKERKLYNWLRNQKLLLLKKYQDEEPQNIPEELREKVKKLKDLGIVYVEKERKAKEETFEEWKTWVLEHKITPSKSSKDDKEKELAQRMNGALTKMKNKPEKYKEELAEYEMLRSKYGRGKSKEERKSKEETFEEWKEWVLEHKITPSRDSKDDNENELAERMRAALTRMKNEPEKYKEELAEYEMLRSKYGRGKSKEERKSKEETFEEWKEWVLEHKITPSVSSKDENEKELAKRMNTTLANMRKEKKKYKAILAEYEKLYSQYGRRKREAKIASKKEEKQKKLDTLTKSQELVTQTEQTLDELQKKKGGPDDVGGDK